MSGHIRALVHGLSLAAALTVAITTWRLIDSPLRYDEVDFSLQAGGIIDHGVPMVIDHGKIEYGMWHPPLYLYSLAASRYALGRGNWAARIDGAIWFGGIALVLWRAAGALSLGLALLSPLIAHGIFFLDIDNTSLAFALTLFGVIFARHLHERSAKTTVLLSLVLFLALWSKLTTPFLLLVALVVFHILNRDWPGLRQTVVVGLIATTAFFITYYLYCELAGYPANFMFDTTYIGKRDAYLSAGQRPLTQSLHAIWWNVIWFSPALSLLFALLTVDRARAYLKRFQLEAIDFWVVSAWVGFGAYAVWGGVMGKYTFPAAVAAVTALGLWLPDQLRKTSVLKPKLLWSAAVTLLLLHVLVIPPLLIKEATFTAMAFTLGTAMRNPRVVALAATFAVFAAFVAIARRATAGPGSTRIATALLMCAVVANSVEAFKLMLSPDDRSPYRAFRERGFEDAVETLNRTLGPTDTIIAPKDVGYYFKGQSHRLDGIRYTQGAAAVIDAIRAKGISHAMDSRVNPIEDSDRLFRAAGLVPVERVGDFVIYRPAR